MNKVWTILNRGAAVDTSMDLARRADPSEYGSNALFDRVARACYPDGDLSKKYFLIERTVEACWASPLRDMFEALDPINTYSNKFPFRELTLSHSPSVLPMAVRFVVPNDARSEWASRGWSCLVSAAGEMSVDGGAFESLEMSNGLSRAVPLDPAASIRLRGSTGVEFGFVVEAVGNPVFDIPAMVAKFESFKTAPWTDEAARGYWRHGSPVERLAAFVYNMTVNLGGGA